MERFQSWSDEVRNKYRENKLRKQMRVRGEREKQRQEDRQWR